MGLTVFISTLTFKVNVIVISNEIGLKSGICLVNIGALYHLRLRFKNFGLSRNALNPTLRPNLRPNSDDSLCLVIDSCKIFGSTLGVWPNKNKTDLGGFSQGL